MTDSDIYQIVGQAYCAGLSEGLEKSASFEKQALSPELLERALKGITEKGDLGRALTMAGRVAKRSARAHEALPWTLSDVPSKLIRAAKPIAERWNKLWNTAHALQDNAEELGLNTGTFFGNGLMQGAGAGAAYANKAVGSLLGSLMK